MHFRRHAIKRAGHETVYAKFLSDQTGIPLDKIIVVQGDSDLIKQGGGTGGSRSVTVQNNATLATVDKMIESFTLYLADKMGVAAEDISFDDETFRAAGSNLTPTFLEAAEMAREDGRDDLLIQEARATLEARSFPNGAHVAEVEIDPETGKLWWIGMLWLMILGTLSIHYWQKVRCTAVSHRVLDKPCVNMWFMMRMVSC